MMPQSLRPFFRRAFAIAGAGAVLGVGSCYPAWSQEVAPPLPELRRSVSVSRQFIIYAADGTQRATLSQFAEETKTALLRLLDLRDAWRLPVVVHLVRPIPGSPGEIPPSQLALAQTGAGLKVQLDLRLRDPGVAASDAEADAVRPRDEIVRALLLELAYRERPELPAGRAFQSPPAWLVEGCAAAVESAILAGGESGDLPAELRAAAQAMASPGGGATPLPVETFLSRNPAGLDSTSRGLYRACAFGMVELLTHAMPDGRGALVAFIRALPAARGESQTSFAALRWHYPDLGDTPDDLQRRWSVVMARLAAKAAGAFEVFGLEETERRLAALLEIRAPAGTATAPVKVQPGRRKRAPLAPAADRASPLAEFEKFLQPGQRHARENSARLRATRAGLLALATQAHPTYRPVVADYEAVVARLSRGAFAGAAGRLRALGRARAESRTRQEAVADYLNWFEATQLNTRSGAFEPYFQLGRQLGSLAPRPRRTDTISTYLDGIEREF